jgi:hypothetical protein
VQHRVAVERFLQATDTKVAHENPMGKAVDSTQS